MSDAASSSDNEVLDPIQRSSEVLFGLIMVLTLSGSLRITGGDQDDVNRMLLAALGCNLAWGIVDAVMYLMAVLSQQSHNIQLLIDARAALPEKGRQLISDAMSSDLAEVLTKHKSWPSVYGLLNSPRPPIMPAFILPISVPP
jgi:hypothetical protein